VASRLLTSATRWKASPADPAGADKQRLITFLLRNGVGCANAVPLRTITAKVRFSKSYSREALQHELIVPLRREGRVFIGTSNRGVYLIESASDADATLSFYTTRIRSELRHVRNLKALTRKYGIFDGFVSSRSGDEELLMFFDESGTPSLADIALQPFFIVCGVVISRKSLRKLNDRFEFIAKRIGKPLTFEFRSGALSKTKYKTVLRELAVEDYQWAAVSFKKADLTSAGFSTPTVFYKYAYQFLVSDLLNIAWGASLYFDEYGGGAGSVFERQFIEYLRVQNRGLPADRIRSISSLRSGQSRLIQLADLLAGVLKNKLDGSFDLTNEVEEKELWVRLFPPS
jgi:hypothetical protein